MGGAAAREVLAAMAEAVGDLLPVGVSIRVSGSGRICDVSVSGPNGGGGSVVLGLGPWLPFLPTATTVRLTAVEALELIQQQVRVAVGADWPGEHSRVSATVRGDLVELVFTDSDGGSRRALPPLARTLFEPASS